MLGPLPASTRAEPGTGTPAILIVARTEVGSDAAIRSDVPGPNPAMTTGR
jgi:hypothetical protein